MGICFFKHLQFGFSSMGSSLNAVTVLGRWGHIFCDKSTKVLVIKHMTMGGGGEGQNLSKLHDVIYGRPLFY